MSVICHHFYNAPIFELAQEKQGEFTSDFVDDVALGIEACTFSHCNKKLNDMMVHKGGAHNWVNTHFVHFELDKTANMEFSHRQKQDPSHVQKTCLLTWPALILDEQTISSSQVHKHIGVILDQELHFADHTQYASGKGTYWATQFHCLSKQSYGMPA